MLVHYNIKNRFVIVSIVLGVEGGEGDASEEGPGAGCKVQTVPTRNDPATGCSLFFSQIFSTFILTTTTTTTTTSSLGSLYSAMYEFFICTKSAMKFSRWGMTPSEIF